jgi:putative membrane protein insertion efficiency factor
MGCCDSSTQLGRDGGIFRAGAGAAEVDSARTEGAGVEIAVEDFEQGTSAAKAARISEYYVVAKATTHKESLIVKHVENSTAGRDAMNVCDNRIMDSRAAAQGPAARWLLLLFVRFYQIFFSPFLGGACKFYPSCSRYAQEAIATHGARRGAWLAMKRLARCRPFTKGGFDPVPDLMRQQESADEAWGSKGTGRSETSAAKATTHKATTCRALEFSDVDWLRTASKERAQ